MEIFLHYLFIFAYNEYIFSYNIVLFFCYTPCTHSYNSKVI